MTRSEPSTHSPGTSVSSPRGQTRSKILPLPRSASASSSGRGTLGSLSAAELNEILARLETPHDLAAFLYDWRAWGRPTQISPAGDWRVWLLLAGRGFGKTRTGAEWVRIQAEDKRARRIALVGPTLAAVREVMIEGESGLFANAHPSFRPKFE